MKILFCYFSSTGNTAKIGKVLSDRLEELGAEVDRVDASRPANRQKPIDMSSYQAAVFGSPIHSMRAPRVFRDWMRTLDGQGKKCAMFFTYGGFQVHPAHYTTQQILKESGFIVTASAEFLGAHTFNLGGWKAMDARPDESDFKVAREYGEAIWKRFTGQDPGQVGELDHGPYTEDQLEGFENVRYKVVTTLPTRNGEDCQMCMICEDICPTGAMDAQTGQAQADKCIVCLGCVKNCPDNVLKVNDLSEFFKIKMKSDQETDETLKRKQSRLYL